MQLRAMQYFCDVVRLGGFTAAAEANYVFYPARDANPLAAEFADILEGLF